MQQPKIYASIMTKFAENQEEAENQDCARKAFCRLIKRLREVFPMLPICICGTVCMRAPQSLQNAGTVAAGICYILFCGESAGSRHEKTIIT